MKSAESAMRDQGLVRVESDNQATALWEEAKQRFDRALADHQDLCAACCK